MLWCYKLLTACRVCRVILLCRFQARYLFKTRRVVDAKEYEWRTRTVVDRYYAYEDVVVFAQVWICLVFKIVCSVVRPVNTRDGFKSVVKCLSTSTVLLNNS